MTDDGVPLRVQVFGADPAHAEREARQLRDLLRQSEGVEARFADQQQPGVGPDGRKGALLTPEVLLAVTGGSSAVLRALIKGWVEVRKSRHARVEFADGSVAELRGGVSGRELNQLRGDEHSRPPEAGNP